MPFTLEHDPVDGSHLIVAGGELDIAATSELSAIFAMSAAGPQDAVVLDLIGVDFIDSSALGTILRAAQSLEASGKRLHVVAPEGPVRRLLEITGTASRFSLHVTRDDFWAYAVIDGRAELTPAATDPADATVEELVEYYRTARGEHPDWDEYRRVMVEEGRLVLRLHPERAYGMVG